MKQNVMTMFRCFNNNAGLEARRNSAVGAFHRNPSPSARCLSAKNSLLRMAMLCLLVGFCTTASAQNTTTISHYKGISGKELKEYTTGHKMQQVAEYHYYYYVKDAKDVINFSLPFENWPNSTSNLEPAGYFRWYNYNSDDEKCASGTLAAYSSSGKLQTYTGWGLVAYNLATSSSTRENIGAKYTPTSSNIDENWEGDVVACDVSRYTDYCANPVPTYGTKTVKLFVTCNYKSQNRNERQSYHGYWTTDSRWNTTFTQAVPDSARCVNDNDHSRYIQYKEVTLPDTTYTYTFDREPTLSIRYVFHILPVSKLAKEWKDTVLKGASSTDVNRNLTYDDNKRIIVGVKNNSSEFNLRLNLDRDINSYYFYGLPGGWISGTEYKVYAKKHVYYSSSEANASNYKITDSDFDSNLHQAGNTIYWRIYDKSKTKYMTLNTQSIFLTLSKSQLSKGTWYGLSDGKKSVTKPTDLSAAYVVAYISGESYYCPIANYELQFTDEYPKTRNEVSGTYRSLESLERAQGYEKAATVDFDFNEVSAAEPANSNENHYKGVPDNFEDNAYSFVYNTSAFPTLTQNVTAGVEHSPLHGDLGYYKVANLNKDASGNTVESGHEYYNKTTGYTWQCESQLKDYTYSKTGQYGYFLYIDAANESRTIATARFIADLCAGNQIIFSGHAAEMTYSGNDQKVQIMFKLYGINSAKEKVLIQSFSSGDMSKNTNNYNTGNWYQVYGSFVLPEGITGNEFDSYAIDIVNMCSSTQGADYAIDQIDIFTRKASIDVVPSEVLCPTADASKVTYKIRAVYETLENKIESGQSKIYYRFMEKDGSSWKEATGIDYNNRDKNYGEADLTNEKNIEGIYYIIANKNFNLSGDKVYYLSINYSDPSNNPGNWGVYGNKCDTYSDTFSNMRRGLSYDTEKTTASAGCENGATKEVTLKVDYRSYDTKTGAQNLLTEVKFDWYIGSDNTGAPTDLASALASWRAQNPTATTYTGSESSITTAIKEGKLILSASNEFTATLGVGSYYIEALPTNTSVNNETICDDLLFPFTITGGRPELILGMDDVSYPDGYKRVVRIGLKQIQQASSTGVLNIPVKDMPDGNLKLTKESAAITLTDKGSNDATVTEKYGQSIANVSSSSLTWSKGSTVLPIKFVSTAATTLHEGYYYDVDVEFKKEDATEQDCSGTTTFRLLIVPEYLTWTGSEGNANWNNDKNWTRSEKSEIFKDDYTDYTSSPSRVSGAYVPMKFSKVTVKELAANSSTLYPSLAGVTKDQTSGIITEMKDGYGNANATDNIQYDMMVTWNKNGTNYSGADDANGTFSCEKFYANTCEQIYFKPRAELLGQQYLTYEKAWVEKELPVNKWAVMASPLRESYAGELYVPYATGQEESEAFKDITFNETSNGRTKYPVYQRNWDCQGKEVLDASTSYDAYDHADQTVTLDKDNNEDKLSVDVAYWSHVYNKVVEKYDAAKGFAVRAGDQYYPNSTLNSSVYTNGEAQPAIVRLPKADIEYTYYDYDGNANSSVKATISKTTGAAYKLLVDADQNTDGSYTETLTNSHNDNQYYLVGNPYAAAINLGAFFKNSENSSAFETSKAWRLNNGVMTAVDNVSSCNIEPMEAFFVKTSSTSTGSVTAKFTADMQVDVNKTSTTNPAKTRASESSDDNETFVMTASSAKSNMQTRASVVVSSSASNDFENDEDVETLYNGDLEDAPTVYTVASSQAVSVNAVPSLDLIPMGVVSKTAEDVNIVIEKSEGTSLYLYDAQTKTSTLLTSGDNITVKSNAHGRYFLSGKAIDINDRTNNDVQIYSPANGIITVATTASDVIQGVEIFSADGKKVAQDAISGDSSKDFYVSGGLYIVKVATSNGVKTQKVAVK